MTLRVTARMNAKSSAPRRARTDHKEILARLAKFDFKSVDFSKNSVDATNRTDHFVEKLPLLNGSGKWGFTDGMVLQGKFDLRGGVESIVGASSQRLQSSASSGGQATVEIAVEEGRVRAYVTGLRFTATGTSSSMRRLEIPAESPGSWTIGATPDRQFRVSRSKRWMGKRKVFSSRSIENEPLLLQMDLSMKIKLLLACLLSFTLQIRMLHPAGFSSSPNRSAPNTR